jgi:hypothetical protein
MLNLAEIKNDLRPGDPQTIFEMTEIPMPTIRAILRGARNAATERGQEVLKAAKKITDTRKELLNQPKPTVSKTKASLSENPANQLEIFHNAGAL